MFRIPTVSLVAAVVSLCVAALIATVSTASDKPRLILQITVDQLRGDFIDRYSAHIGEGGFRSLQEHAVTFSNAHHRHANNETIVGHTTLSTGTDPAIDGMVANLWFDRKTGTQFYNVQDPEYPLVGAAGIDTTTEIDPTQALIEAEGLAQRRW